MGSGYEFCKGTLQEDDTCPSTRDDCHGSFKCGRRSPHLLQKLYGSSDTGDACCKHNLQISNKIALCVNLCVAIKIEDLRVDEVHYSKIGRAFSAVPTCDERMEMRALRQVFRTRARLSEARAPCVQIVHPSNCRILFYKVIGWAGFQKHGPLSRLWPRFRQCHCWLGPRDPWRVLLLTFQSVFSWRVPHALLSQLKTSCCGLLDACTDINNSSRLCLGLFCIIQLPN